MTWPPLYTIASRIDDLATSLNTPDYEPLLEIDDMPFQYPDKVAASLFLAIHLETDGTGSVSYSRLTSDAAGEASYTLPGNLALMSGDESTSNLYFITTPDSCLCSHIFKVIDASGVGGHTLLEVTAGVCCISAWVPDTGDTVPGAECVFVDEGILELYLDGNPSTLTDEIPRKACDDDPATLNNYIFSDVSPDGELSIVTRSLEGFFTWEAKADYMNQMWDAMEYILDCKNNGGSVVNFWKTGASDHVYEYCSPTIDQVVASMKDFSEPETLLDEPGCLREYPSLPWETVTCGGVTCGSESKKTFYCETILQFNKILGALESGLKAFDGTQTGCCCPPEIDYIIDEGYAVACGCEFAGELCTGYDYEYTNSDPMGEPPYCNVDCAYSGDAGEIVTAVNTDPACNAYTYNDTCTEEEEWTLSSSSSSGCVEVPSCDDLCDAAITALGASPGEIYEVGCGYASKGSYRIKMMQPVDLPPPTCSGETFDITYDLLKIADSSILLDEITSLTVTMSWDATLDGVGGFVSDEVDFPGDPGYAIDGLGGYSDIYWAFDFTEVGETPVGKRGIGCPRCYYEGTYPP